MPGQITGKQGSSSSIGFGTESSVQKSARQKVLHRTRKSGQCREIIIFGTYHFSITCDIVNYRTDMGNIEVYSIVINLQSLSMFV